MLRQLSWASWGRARLACGVVALAVVLAWLPWRGERGAESWSAALSSHGIEEARKIQWLYEHEPGAWTPAVAEAIPERSKRRDIIVFEGMVDGDGEPYRVRRVGNLTRTADADDALLAMDSTLGRQLLAASSALDGKITSVSLFDLKGDPLTWRDEYGHKRPWGDTFKLATANYQESGRASGVSRRSYVLQNPATGVTARFDNDHLVFSGTIPGEEGSRQAWGTVRALDGALLDVHASSLGLRDQTLPPVLDRWIQFAVNRARAHPWVGANKIALLEKYVFDHVDTLRRAWYDVFGGDNEALAIELSPETAQEVAEPERILEASKDAILIEGLDDWPPKSIDPPAKVWGGKEIAGEGRYTAWIPEWINLEAHKDRPWPVYRTAIRITHERRFDPITFVAMDLRQLDLHLVAGIISPRSTTGYRGTGEIPRDPAILKRVLLAFTGGFKTAHGAYGVLLEKRLFVPHKPAMASLAIYKDRAVRMGTWPGKGHFGNYGEERRWQQEIDEREKPPPIPSDVVDLRQNLAPLVANGVLNPSGAVRWGGVVDHLTHTNTPRSGVCIKGENTLLFVWCRRCGAGDLGNGMIAAGCDYGMHLDMNPYHTGMSMIHVPVEGDKVPREGFEHRLQGALVEKASRQMDFDKDRYIGRDIKDFFYLTWRDNLPRRLGQPEGFEPWSTKGLPVTGGGVEPLALISNKGDTSVLAFAGKHFEASRADIPESLPDPGERGDVQIGVWITAPAPSGGEQGRLVVQPSAARLFVEGIPSTDPKIDALLKGRTLFFNGAPAARPPKTLPEDALLAAQTLSGDLLFIHSKGGDLSEVNGLLEGLDVDSALLLGAGGFEAITFDGAWKAAFAAADRVTPTAQIKLKPLQPRARTGLTTFEGPLVEAQ